MTEKILEFMASEPLIWSCSCGNQSFFIHDTGEVECVVCGAYQSDDVQGVVTRKKTRVIDAEILDRWIETSRRIEKELGIDD